MSRTDLKQTKPTRSAADKIAHRAFRALMRTQRLTWAHMAARTGYSIRTLKWQNSRGWPSHRVRVAVEDSMGCPIFFKPAVFDQRQEQKARLGFCPVFATRPELRALARRIGVVGAANFPNRKHLLKELLAKLAVGKRPAVPSTLTRTSP